MLCNIDSSVINDAHRILTLLCFATRPLTVQELIDGIAVEIDSARLNDKRRLQNADDIFQICSGFIEIETDFDDQYHDLAKSNDEVEQTKVVRIAHFSVQEYLESERIERQKAANFSLKSGTAHAEIAQICLIYLLEPGLSSIKLDRSVFYRYPLAQFAAEYWHYHYENAKIHISNLNNLILELFRSQCSF